jgi:hypothetical protein
VHLQRDERVIGSRIFGVARRRRRRVRAAFSRKIYGRDYSMAAQIKMRPTIFLLLRLTEKQAHKQSESGRYVRFRRTPALLSSALKLERR